MTSGRRRTTGGQRTADPDPVRLVAWQTLRAVDAEDAYANLVLPARLRRARLSGRDAAFVTELTYGTLRGLRTYDAVLGQCSDRPVADIDPEVRDALRLGVHQLLGMRVPTHAAVDSTVELVRAEVGRGAGGFSNAVLRRVAEHDRDAWLERIVPPGTATDTRLALTHSHPEWIVRALRESLVLAGRDAAELVDLLQADNQPATPTIVALPGLTEVDDLVAHGGVAGSLSPYAVRLDGDPGRLEAVRERRARVQDEGSQVVTLALVDAEVRGPDTGRWLDLCAGPGGKTALLAAVLDQRMAAGQVPADSLVIANEVTPHRAELVRRALPPTDVRVQVRTGDGRDVDELSRELPDAAGFDRVLVDAPCTGLGALRRRPEARWRRQPSDLSQLGPLQRQLLGSALDLVRPGGVVGYVTCSPHPAETALVVDDVLKRRGDAARLRPDLRLWPHVDGCDAMYLALIERT